MAVSKEYLDKVGMATIRREPGDDSDPAMDNLLIDYIEACRSDLIRLGVAKEVVLNEELSNVLGAICSFVRWKLSYNGSDSTPNRDEYKIQADELRKSTLVDYVPEPVTEEPSEDTPSEDESQEVEDGNE